MLILLARLKRRAFSDMRRWMYKIRFRHLRVAKGVRFLAPVRIYGRARVTIERDVLVRGAVDCDW